MARGAVAKKQVTDKILEVFQGSFINDKELRVPMIEDGELIEIKVTLTAAKTNIGNGVAAPAMNTTSSGAKSEVTSAKPVQTEPTAEEKKNLENLLNKLGL